MKIAGIDYSLRCPCVCTFHYTNEEDSFQFMKCQFNFITDVIKYQSSFLNIHGSKYSNWSADIQRYETLADWTIQFIADCDQVAIEGYSYSSSGKVFHIAENTGILKYKLYQMSNPLTVYPPTEIKKFATGKGNSDTEEMYQSFLDETLVDLRKILLYERNKIESPLSDIVDSFYICKKLFYNITC